MPTHLAVGVCTVEVQDGSVREGGSHPPVRIRSEAALPWRLLVLHHLLVLTCMIHLIINNKLVSKPGQNQGKLLHAAF